MRHAYFLPRIFYIMQSRPKTLPCHSCGRILVLWILLKEKKFKPLEPNDDCISLPPLLGSILNSLGIFCAQCLPNKSNLLPPVSRKQVEFLKASSLQLSAIYCGKHSRVPKEVLHKISHIMKVDQNPAQNNSLDTASNGKNALASLGPTNGC